MGKLFYSEIKKGLKDELDNRKDFFSNKNSDFFDMFGSPYISVTLVRRFDGKEYSINNSDKVNVEDVYDFDYKNLPNPVVESAKIYSEGRYASLKKADIEIKLYHIRQLDELESFLMIPGNGVRIGFGLSYYASKMDDKYELYNMELENKIYNFSYTVDDQSGTISFSLQTVGEGFFASSIDMNTKLDIEVINEDDTSEEENKSNSVLSYLYNLIDSYLLKWGVGFSKYDPNTGIAKFMLSPSWEYETQNEFESSSNEFIWYITLNGLIEIINRDILERRNIDNISYEGEAISTYNKNIISADPTQIVFPDKNMGNYSRSPDTSVTYSNFGRLSELNNKFRESDKINLGYILISIDHIATLFDQILINDEDENIPIRKFFNKLFNSIYENSGNVYDLSLTIQEQDEENINLSILDSNYIDESVVSEPYIFNILNDNNIITNFSIESSLPDKMATAMYVGGSSSKNVNPKIYSFLTRESDTYYDPNIPNPVYSAEEWEDLKRDKKIEQAKKDIEFYVDKIGKNGVEDSTKSSLKAALKSFKSLDTDANWNKNLVYPLDLSVSLHGITGFKFGNIITIDYLPDRYLTNDSVSIIFMITKIDHEIQNNKWITTLTTQCRMRS